MLRLISVQSMQENTVAISVDDNKIVVKNATDNITVTDISGRVLKTVNAMEAAQGITMSQGLYIVKANDLTQKVMIQ